MGVDIDFSKLSLDDLMALAKRANEVKKDMLDADAQRLGALAQGLADVVLAERETQTAPISGWEGVKVFSLPVTGPDERKFTASVTFTDTEATETAKAEIKAKSGAAYDAHLAAVAAKKSAAKNGTTPPSDDADTGEGDESSTVVVVKAGARK